MNIPLTCKQGIPVDAHKRNKGVLGEVQELNYFYLRNIL